VKSIVEKKVIFSFNTFFYLLQQSSDTRIT